MVTFSGTSQMKSLSELQQRFLDIATDVRLSPKQKSNFLALEAEACIPYMSISPSLRQAMDEGIICDMFEGHAPFKPRYVLPDYAKFLLQGSEYLELLPADDFDDALNMLTIIYHHVPSVTNIPVYLGQLDDVLLPYIGDLTENQIYKKLKHFWIMLDRTLPDAFMHVNVGPTDNIICRTILKVDAELKQIAPNLTFMYDESVTPDDLLRQATQNICECSKPHIANYPVHSKAYSGSRFGIVSCYNSLLLAGGSNTLVRMNLKEVAERASDCNDFLNSVLPLYHQLMVELMDARSTHLHEKSNFFQGFLTQEVDRVPFRTNVWHLWYGRSGEPSVRKRRPNGGAVRKRTCECFCSCFSHTGETSGVNPQNMVWMAKRSYMLKAVLAILVTPGVRLPYGTEPDPVTYVQATAEHHQYYRAGISDILTIDETVKSNPEAMFNLCKGGVNAGYREFTANVASNDLIRVTGYMVKLSDIAKYDAEGSRTNTTFLGAEAAKNTGILDRSPRVVSHEMTPTYTQA
ncbi:LOW QUALITY PROTEIN: hypothetical protein JCM18905_1038 [Vibrio sp. JCM 18905]|nr:LOW QUALITY PROTEIN: hypothetical protein JCM18905_1038 [Vibrio sp. JCM 18905]